MSLVRVWTDIGTRKPVPLVARITERNGAIFTIRYLSESDDKIWRYEDETYEVDDDSIAEFLGSDDEVDIGFQVVENGFLKLDSDEDYIPSSESESESYEEEDEEEQVENEEEEEESEDDDEA